MYSLQHVRDTWNQARRVDFVSQRLGDSIRCGEPDAIDAIVPMDLGNRGLELILRRATRRLVGLRDTLSIDLIGGVTEVVDLYSCDRADRLRLQYEMFERQAALIKTSEQSSTNGSVVSDLACS